MGLGLGIREGGGQFMSLYKTALVCGLEQVQEQGLPKGRGENSVPCPDLTRAFGRLAHHTRFLFAGV